MGFSRQEYWSGLPFPSPGDLPNPGIKPRSPGLQADSLRSEPPGKPPDCLGLILISRARCLSSFLAVYRSSSCLLLTRAAWSTFVSCEMWSHRGAGSRGCWLRTRLSLSPSPSEGTGCVMKEHTQEQAVSCGQDAPQLQMLLPGQCGGCTRGILASLGEASVHTQMCQGNAGGRCWWRERGCEWVPVLKHVGLHCFFLWKNAEQLFQWEWFYCQVTRFFGFFFFFHQSSEMWAASCQDEWTEIARVVELWKNRISQFRSCN